MKGYPAAQPEQVPIDNVSGLGKNMGMNTPRLKHGLRPLARHLLLPCACLLIIQGHADLVGYWSLDGDTDADAGGWGTSTIQAGANAESDTSFPNDVPTAISLRMTQSLAFDANNDDRVITGFNAGTAGISGMPGSTISYWIKRAVGTTSNGGMVFLGNAGTGPGAVISLERNGNNLAAYYFNGNRISAGGFVADQWIHVAHTYDTNHGTSQLYFNGANVSGSTANPGNILNIPTDATVSFGDRVGGIDPTTDFRLAEFAVWNEILDPGQIIALAGGTSPLLIPEPNTGSLLILGVLLLNFRQRRNRR